MSKDPITLQQKIGQMLMIGFHGSDDRDQEAQIALAQARRGEIGGVIFFSYNIQGPDQVRNLTRAFREVESEYPLLIAVDQEGGKVQRLNAKNGFNDFHSARHVGSSMTPQMAKTYYSGMAMQLSDAGFNCNFGPVVDLHSHPNNPIAQGTCPAIGRIERAYANVPATIVSYAGAFIDAFREQGLITSIKHYPGHGLAKLDSHKGMVDVTDTHTKIEREPFKQLIKQGKADIIMTAHLMNRNLDPKYPATMSKGVLTNWLRNEDGYDGVIVTDDLHMGAVQQHYKLEEIIIKAINAGVDILLFSNNAAAAQNVKNFSADNSLAAKFQSIVMKAITQGKISKKRIEQSFDRIVKLKSRLNPDD